MKDGGIKQAALRFWPYIAHLPVLAFTFAGALFKGQVFFFRDIVFYYYPNYVFLERSLRQGVWPLWNPTSDAGAPFLMANGRDPGKIDERTLSSYLYTAGQPDPDLLIRTSGEMRVSNFLLWQIAYAEIWVTEVLWPDFRRKHLLQAVADFQKRERRYGGITPA